MDIAVTTDHRIKLKESEKKDKHQDFARRDEKTMKHERDGDTNCNWCSWYSHKGLIKGLDNLELRGQVKTIQTTALLTSARILRRVLKTWGDLL